MIDTIKLLIPFSEPPNWPNANFSPPIDAIKGAKGYIRAMNNLTGAEKSQGIYRPRFTFSRRVIGKSSNIVYELSIEVSLPKLLLGNNFEEVSEKNFNAIVKKIVESANGAGVLINRGQIVGASVSRIDFGKNIILPKYASAASVIKDIASADISKIYNTRATTFENGGTCFQIHCNDMNIAFYDKNADLRRSLISEKRSLENDSHIQKHLISLEKDKRTTLRFEIRFLGKRRIRTELRATGAEIDNKLLFADIFKQDIAGKVLTMHWNKITSKIPKAKVLYATTPLQMYEKIIENKSVKPQGSLATLGLLLLNRAENADIIRSVIEKRFGQMVWYRIKRLLDAGAFDNRLKVLLFVGETIAKMEPITKAHLRGK